MSFGPFACVIDYVCDMSTTDTNKVFRARIGEIVSRYIRQATATFIKISTSVRFA